MTRKVNADAGDWEFLCMETAYRVEPVSQYKMPYPFTWLGAYRMAHALPESCVACGKLPVHDVLPVRLCNKCHDSVFLAPLCVQCVKTPVTRPLKISYRDLELFAPLYARLQKHQEHSKLMNARKFLVKGHCFWVEVRAISKSKRHFRLPDNYTLLKGYSLIQKLPPFCPGCTKRVVNGAAIVCKVGEEEQAFILPLCSSCLKNGACTDMLKRVKMPDAVLVRYDDVLAAIELNMTDGNF